VPRSGMNAEGLRQGLFETLDRVIDRPVVLFGSSMGGLAAIRYAHARPENVRALILMSPGGASMTPCELEKFVGTFAMDSHQDALSFVDRMLARPAAPLLRPVLAWGVRKKIGHPNMRALLASLTCNDLIDPVEHLSRLSMPIYFVWGGADRVLPAAHREFFRKHLPRHARIEEPAGFSHNPYLEQPDAVASMLLRYVRDASIAAVPRASNPSRRVSVGPSASLEDLSLPQASGF
jgi:pimeloyl-ACP methyl ester carboxylesterase